MSSQDQIGVIESKSLCMVNHIVKKIAVETISVTELAELNDVLNELYDLIYDDAERMTAEEVQAVVPQLEDIVSAIKGLHSLCREMQSNASFEEQVMRLGRNYSAFYELSHDLARTYDHSYDNEEFSALAAKVTEALRRIG